MLFLGSKELLDQVTLKDQGIKCPDRNEISKHNGSDRGIQAPAPYRTSGWIVHRDGATVLSPDPFECREESDTCPLLREVQLALQAVAEGKGRARGLPLLQHLWGGLCLPGALGVSSS